MSFIIYGILGAGCGFGLIGWYLWFDFYTKTKDLSAPFLKVARSKGKKILLLVDTGAGSYKLVDAEREALGYTTKDFGNFEAYEEGIKPFGSGVKKVPLGLAHAELEVNIPPATAVWIQQHGGQLTQKMIDKMPDVVQYLYCDNEIKKDDICGWIGPLIPQEEDKPSSVKELWNLGLKLKEKEFETEKPICPKCKSDLKEVKSDRTYSVIPNHVVYALHNVRKWVEEVVSPLNMEMAIESTKLNTMKKAKNNMDEIMKYVLILGPLLMFGAIAYVMVTQQTSGGESGFMENMGQTLKSGAGQ